MNVICVYNTGYYIMLLLLLYYYVHLGEGRIEGKIQINYKIILEFKSIQ